MILPIHDLIKTRLSSVLGELYQLPSSSIPDITIQYPPNRTLGDLAITVAFELARTLRKAPRVIADEIISALGEIHGVDHLEATPNGYINVFLNRGSYIRNVLNNSPDQHFAKGQKAIVEHTAITPNKAAHIGHLRNAALGDTLVRVLRFRGTPVEVQNYIDDTGVQVADVVVGFEQLRNASYEQIKKLSEQPLFDHHCWDLYAQVTEWYEADKTRLEHRTKALPVLDNGTEPTSQLGQLIADSIVRCHLLTMERLNIDYDLLSWEGDILRLEFWPPAFEILKKSQAIYLETNGPQTGCWVMPIDASNTDANQDATENSSLDETNDGGPKSRTKVVVRSNGTVTYVGKDIAYQFWKFGILQRDFHYRPYETRPTGDVTWTTTTALADSTNSTAPDFGQAASVYNVIDTRQSYLQQLLKQALKAAGYPEQAGQSVHVSYEMVALSHATAQALGHVNVKDSTKPFVEVSGRKGLGVKADDLLDRLKAAALQEVIQRHEDLTVESEEANAIATAISIAAVRYFMIKYSRGKLIAFDIEEALSFDGESGPYVQYSVVRATNILKKLKTQHECGETEIVTAVLSLSDASLGDPDGTTLWALVLEASRLDEIADQAIRTLELSVLAKYSFNLAQMFNTFYHQCPVLKETNRDVRLWRAAAVFYCRQQLVRTLDLMGCEVPPRM